MTLVYWASQGIGAVNNRLATLRTAIDASVESRLGIDALEAGMADALSRIAIAFETPLCPHKTRRWRYAIRPKN